MEICSTPERVQELHQPRCGRQAAKVKSEIICILLELQFSCRPPWPSVQGDACNCWIAPHSDGKRFYNKREEEGTDRAALADSTGSPGGFLSSGIRLDFQV